MSHQINPSWWIGLPNSPISVVEPSTYGAMGHQINPSYWTDWADSTVSVGEPSTYAAIGHHINPSWWIHWAIHLWCDESSDQSFMVDPLSYFLLQPVLHSWCNKGHGLYYFLCRMVQINVFLLLIRTSSWWSDGCRFPISQYLNGPLHCVSYAK